MSVAALRWRKHINGARYGLVISHRNHRRLVCIEPLDSSAAGDTDLNGGQLSAAA